MRGFRGVSVVLAVLSLCACSQASPQTEPSETATASAPEAVERPAIPQRTVRYRNEPRPDRSDSVVFNTPVGYTGEDNQVALTFDDGPSKYTEEVLDILKRYNVKATFCVIGPNIEGREDVLKRIVREGHALCNHSTHHNSAMGSWSVEEAVDELEITNEAIEQVVGATPVYFRAPEGVFRGSTLEALRELRMIPLSWSADSQDWQRPGADAILQNLTAHTSPHEILLMHDGGGPRDQTVEALPAVIETLKDQGFEFTRPWPHGHEAPEFLNGFPYDSLSQWSDELTRRTDELAKS